MTRSGKRSASSIRIIAVAGLLAFAASRLVVELVRIRDAGSVDQQTVLVLATTIAFIATLSAAAAGMFVAYLPGAALERRVKAKRPKGLVWVGRKLKETRSALTAVGKGEVLSGADWYVAFAFNDGGLEIWRGWRRPRIVLQIPVSEIESVSVSTTRVAAVVVPNIVLRLRHMNGAASLPLSPLERSRFGFAQPDAETLEELSVSLRELWCLPGAGANETARTQPPRSLP